MGKDKGKKQNQKNARKQGDKQPGKAARERVALRDIARSERKLAGALQTLDDARAELTRREMQLATLLRKHGRMPDEPAQAPSYDYNAAETPTTTAEASAQAVLAEATGAEPAPQPAPSETTADRRSYSPDEH